jgi:hypothetical protein
MRYPVLLLTLILSGFAVAAPPSDRPPELAPVPDGAPAPGDEPSVTIKESGQGQVVEYRANGKLFMLKVIPKGGKPYYLVDRTGDGQFVWQGNLGADFQPPMWVLIEF